MVSLWGTKKGDDDENGNAPLLHDDAESSGTPRHSEPDERTHLLPPPPNGHDGYLSPDDPAVSRPRVWLSVDANNNNRYLRTTSGACA